MTLKEIKKKGKFKRLHFSFCQHRWVEQAGPLNKTFPETKGTWVQFSLRAYLFFIISDHHSFLVAIDWSPEPVLMKKRLEYLFV